MLRECPEPSNFVSNLLVTKKRNGDIRILLDGRLLNNATIRKATVLVSPIEVFAHAAQKAYISTIDISNYHAMIFSKRGSTSRGLTFRLRQNIGAKTFVLI